MLVSARFYKAGFMLFLSHHTQRIYTLNPSNLFFGRNWFSIYFLLLIDRQWDGKIMLKVCIKIKMKCSESGEGHIIAQLFLFPVEYLTGGLLLTGLGTLVEICKQEQRNTNTIQNI